MNCLSIRTRSAVATAEVGSLLGNLLSAGDFVTLAGDLGAGKTQFVKGVALGLQVDPGIPVTSPTYTILNEYSGRIPLYHFDLYRLSGGDCDALGFDEYFEGQGACFVEWPERLGEALPDERIEVEIVTEDENQRLISFRACGKRFSNIILQLCEAAKKVFDPADVSCY